MGDDCIAVKAGKFTVGAKYKVYLLPISESASAVCGMGMVQLRWGVRWRQESKNFDRQDSVCFSIQTGGFGSRQEEDAVRML